MVTSASEVQKLDLCSSIAELVETLEAIFSNICPTNLVVTLRTSDVAYLYWCITSEGNDDYSFGNTHTRPLCH